MTKTTILMTLIIAMTFIVLVTTSSAYAQVSNFYWSEDDLSGEVFTADSATQTVTQVTSGGFIRIDDVEIDPLANRLWWNHWGAPFLFGSASEGIYSSNLDGTGQLQVTGAAQSTTINGAASGLTGIVLDPANQIVFFTRGVSYAQNVPPNSGGEVSRVNMDGTGYLKLNINNDSWHPDGIELDSSSNTLLWGDAGVLVGAIGASGPVNCMDTSGGNRQVSLLPQMPGQGRSLALDAANGLLFYSSHDAFGRGSGGGIFVTSPCSAAVPTQILNDPDTGIPDIELDAANMRIYWTDYTNGQINSASYDAAGNLGPITTELSGLTKPYGLALEFAQADDDDDDDDGDNDDDDDDGDNDDDDDDDDDGDNDDDD